jgi:hypothetical protein
LDLKMPLENGRADERVSRGQASERAVRVCEAVSVEKGARRPPLQTAVVCPPGRCRRRRLAITAAEMFIPREQQQNPGCQEEMKCNTRLHTADTLRNVILSCHSIRDARNLSDVHSNCCYGATGASLTAREATCTHVCHMRVYSKHKVHTAMIIMKGPRATTGHRLPTPRPAKLKRVSNAIF